MRETNPVVVDNVLGFLLFLIRHHRANVLTMVLRSLPWHIEFCNANRKPEHCERIERTTSHLPIECIAVQVTLNTDTGNRNSLCKKTANLCHVIRKPVSCEYVVII